MRSGWRVRKLNEKKFLGYRGDSIFVVLVYESRTIFAAAAEFRELDLDNNINMFHNK